MPTAVFLSLVFSLWMVVLLLFVWMHRPEQTVAEIIRSLESRS